MLGKQARPNLLAHVLAEPTAGARLSATLYCVAQPNRSEKKTEPALPAGSATRR